MSRLFLKNLIVFVPNTPCTNSFTQKSRSSSDHFIPHPAGVSSTWAISSSVRFILLEARKLGKEGYLYISEIFNLTSNKTVETGSLIYTEISPSFSSFSAIAFLIYSLRFGKERTIASISGGSLTLTGVCLWVTPNPFPWNK